jgi:alkylhydroperoxidase/carboxymuconolactone decarboxylase family protein YurZ
MLHILLKMEGATTLWPLRHGNHFKDDLDHLLPRAEKYAVAFLPGSSFQNAGVSVKATEQEPIYLPEVEANQQPSPYADLIAALKAAGRDHWQIWNLFAYKPEVSHSAAAAEHLGGDDANYALIETVKADFAAADISPKLKGLLAIAGKVQQGGKHVTPKDIAAARAQGATDREIHDTVLIAAPSACSTDMSMALRPGNRRIPQTIGSWVR